MRTRAILLAHYAAMPSDFRLIAALHAYTLQYLISALIARSCLARLPLTFQYGHFERPRAALPHDAELDSLPLIACRASCAI